MDFQPKGLLFRFLRLFHLRQAHQLLGLGSPECGLREPSLAIKPRSNSGPVESAVGGGWGGGDVGVRWACVELGVVARIASYRGAWIPPKKVDGLTGGKPMTKKKSVPLLEATQQGRWLGFFLRLPRSDHHPKAQEAGHRYIASKCSALLTSVWSKFTAKELFSRQLKGRLRPVHVLNLGAPR